MCEPRVSESEFVIKTSQCTFNLNRLVISKHIYNMFVQFVKSGRICIFQGAIHRRPCFFPLPSELVLLTQSRTIKFQLLAYGMVYLRVESKKSTIWLITASHSLEGFPNCRLEVQSTTKTGQPWIAGGISDVELIKPALGLPSQLPAKKIPPTVSL